MPGGYGHRGPRDPYGAHWRPDRRDRFGQFERYSRYSSRYGGRRVPDASKAAPAGRHSRPAPAHGVRPAPSPSAASGSDARAGRAPVAASGRFRVGGVPRGSHASRLARATGLAAAVAGVGLAGALGGVLLLGNRAPDPERWPYATQATYTQSQTPTLAELCYTTVSFSAVGDNLMNYPVVEAADANLGTVGDGLYDFTPMYSGVQDIVQSSDLNFIDIETILGGDYLGISGYPIFNSPEAIAAEVADFGWNLATTATNHSLDMGIEGINNSSATWANYPQVTVTGTFTSQEDRDRIRVVEQEGITFAFLAYTDSTNGIPIPEGYEYAVAMADDEAMVSDVTRAKELADVIIVAMSWGNENDFVPSDSQRHYAQLLANLGVDLVVGFGPHVIQPIEWYTGLDEAGNPTGSQTLVVFSLGNFLSNQPYSYAEVEGCFTCTFERLGDQGPVTITNLKWTPLINHIDGSYHEVFKLKDYTYELAWAHDVMSAESDPIAYARQLTLDIIGPSGVEIDM